MRPVSALFLVVLAYLGFAAFYAVKTPYRTPGLLLNQGRVLVPDIGAPDERQHVNYVTHLLEGQGFPVLVPGSPDLGETYQAHQPPLYYVLAAGFAKVVGVGAQLRWLNILIGVGTLFGVFYLAKWGLEDEWLGVAAAALAGLLPMFVALHAAVSNDPLLFLLCTWTAALCARGVRQGWSMALALWIGACVGLGLLTKTTALALLPTVFCALLFSYFWGTNKAKVATWAIALALPLLIGAPWMARNQKLYGDPFAISAFNAAFVGSPRPQDVVIPARINTDPVYNEAANKVLPGLEGAAPREQIDAIYEEVGLTTAAKVDYWTNWVGWWTARSFIGVFSYMDIFLFEKMGPAASGGLYRLLLAILAVPVVAWAWSSRGWTKSERAVHLTNLVLVLVVTALFVRFNLQYFQGQARYLYPAIGPIAIGLAWGLMHLLRRRKDSAWLVATIFLLLVQIAACQALVQGFATRVR